MKFILNGIERDTEDLSSDQFHTLQQMHLTESVVKILQEAFNSYNENLEESLQFSDALNEHGVNDPYQFND